MIQSLGRLLSAAVLVFALGIASTLPSRAQSQADIPDAKLESFVVAAIAVQDLIKQWSPRIEKAQSEEEANTLRQQAQTEFVKAVEQTEGMTLEEYQTIGQQAQQDPQLNSRIQEIYQEKVEQ